MYNLLFITFTGTLHWSTSLAYWPIDLEASLGLVWLAKIVKIVFTVSKTSYSLIESYSPSIISLFVSAATDFCKTTQSIFYNLKVTYNLTTVVISYTAIQNGVQIRLYKLSIIIIQNLPFTNNYFKDSISTKLIQVHPEYRA